MAAIPMLGRGNNMTFGATNNGASQSPQYVTELRASDVLFGRGSGPNDHEGNVRFRTLVAERKAEYMATNHRLTKAKIAKEIVDTVFAANGRFLKKLEPKDSEKLGYRADVDVYEIADDDTIMEKAKQALRQNTQKIKQPGVQSNQASDRLSPKPTTPLSPPPVALQAPVGLPPPPEIATGAPESTYDNFEPIPISLPSSVASDIPHSSGHSGMGPPGTAEMPTATTSHVWMDNTAATPSPAAPMPPALTRSSDVGQQRMHSNPSYYADSQARNHISMKEIPQDEYPLNVPPPKVSDRATSGGSSASRPNMSRLGSLQMSDLMDSFHKLKTMEDGDNYNRSAETMGTIDGPMSVGSMNDMSLGDSTFSIFDSSTAGGTNSSKLDIGKTDMGPPLTRGISRDTTSSSVSKLTLSSASEASMKFSEIWSRRPNYGSATSTTLPPSMLGTPETAHQLQSSITLAESGPSSMDLGGSIQTINNRSSMSELKRYLPSSTGELDDSMTGAQQYLAGDPNLSSQNNQPQQQYQPKN